MPSVLLTLRRAARHLLDFALGRTAGIFAGLQRIVCLALLARCTLAFLSFFLAQCACVCHECCLFLLKKSLENLPLAASFWLLTQTSSLRCGQELEARSQKLLYPFQLGILLHQLLQTEARELYRNLGIFTFSFALVHRAFAIFAVSYTHLTLPTSDLV